MGIGVDAGCGSAKRGGAVESADRRLGGMFATLLALLAGWIASPPLQATITITTFACKVGGGRTVEVLAARQLAYHGDHPWQVAIFREDDFSCGGVLLGAEWVLTTGHCVASDSPQSLAVGHGASDLGEAWTARHAVGEIHLHPEFDDQQGLPQNDLALLRLADPVENLRNSHANLPTEGEVRAFERPGTCAVVTSWGNWRREKASRLQAADQRIMSGKECREAYGKDGISAGQICAGQPRDSFATVDDAGAGGALTAGGAPNRPRWLLGVLSRSSILDDQGAKPDVYTRVSHYAVWIKRTMARPGNGNGGVR